MWSKIRELENEDTIVKMKNLSEKFVVTKARTSSAGSATLGDTSRARLTTELITFQFRVTGQQLKLGWGPRTNL